MGCFVTFVYGIAGVIFNVAADRLNGSIFRSHFEGHQTASELGLGLTGLERHRWVIGHRSAINATRAVIVERFNFPFAFRRALVCGFSLVIADAILGGSFDPLT